MTLIECFTPAHIDNITACLSLRPEKMILLGEQDKIEDPIKRYRKILEKRHQRTVIKPCPVDETDLHSICQTIRRLLLQEKDVVIDMTGGEELVIMAIGAVIASLTEEERKNVRVQKMDPEDGLVHDCIHPGQSYTCKCAELTIEEMLLLGEGELRKHEYKHIAGAKFSDLDDLWNIIADDPDTWNKTLTYLIEFESHNQKEDYDENGYLNLDIELDIAALRCVIGSFYNKYSDVLALLNTLNGPVIQIECTGDLLKYRYKTRLLRYCTQKAGNTLEVKTLLAGRSVLKNGVPYFRESMMSVEILWEGKSLFEDFPKPKPKNEIDVILMRGTVPLFISCKNGAVKEDELYKFNSVANHFGGENAKKLLVATHVDESLKANRSIIQRAWNMDILLITDADTMTKQEWRDTLMEAMS